MNDSDPLPFDDGSGGSCGCGGGSGCDGGPGNGDGGPGNGDGGLGGRGNCQIGQRAPLPAPGPDAFADLGSANIGARPVACST